MSKTTLIKKVAKNLGEKAAGFYTEGMREEKGRERWQTEGWEFDIGYFFV